MLLRVRDDLVKALSGQLESTVAHVDNAAVEFADDPSSQFFILVRLLILFLLLESGYIELTEAVLDLLDERFLALRVMLNKDAFGSFQ